LKTEGFQTACGGSLVRLGAFLDRHSLRVCGFWLPIGEELSNPQKLLNTGYTPDHTEKAGDIICVYYRSLYNLIGRVSDKSY
jgi:hypothetical protein